MTGWLSRIASRAAGEGAVTPVAPATTGWVAEVVAEGPAEGRLTPVTNTSADPPGVSKAGSAALVAPPRPAPPRSTDPRPMARSVEPPGAERSPVTVALADIPDSDIPLAAHALAPVAIATDVAVDQRAKNEEPVPSPRAAVVSSRAAEAVAVPETALATDRPEFRSTPTEHLKFDASMPEAMATLPPFAVPPAPSVFSVGRIEIVVAPPPLPAPPMTPSPKAPVGTRGFAAYSRLRRGGR